MPEAWIQDPARCTQAGIPATVTFATKPELVQQMVTRARGAALPVRWFVGDAVYGADALRLWLESQELWYVVAIACTTGIWKQGRQINVAALIAQQPLSAWVRLSAGAGSQGERWYDWTWLRLPVACAAGMAQWVIARRSITTPNECAYYRAPASATTSLADLVRVAGIHWVIEVGFAQAKEERGRDQYEVRQWGAWYRHITLVLVMYAYLVALRVQAQHNDTDSTLVPITVPEGRRSAHALAAAPEECQHLLSRSQHHRHLYLASLPLGADQPTARLVYAAIPHPNTVIPYPIRAAIPGHSHHAGDDSGCPILGGGASSEAMGRRVP